MFEFGAGIYVPKTDEIREEYELSDDRLIANVSLPNLPGLIQKFYRQLEEPLFFILHIPSNLSEKNESRFSDQYPLHEDIYYLDDCKASDLDSIFQQYGSILFHDGLIKFGVASQLTEDELFVDKYHVVVLFSDLIDKFRPLLEEFGIKPSEHIKKPWDTFTEEAPGRARQITAGDKSIYDILEELKEKGLYYVTTEEA